MRIPPLSSQAVEGMCHGGQILTTMETWKAVSGMAERYLGRPQILDCGEHLLFETKNANPAASGGGYTTTRYIRRVMQLVPSDLAFDFFEARGRREVKSEDGKMGFEIKDAGTVKVRLFPPPHLQEAAHNVLPQRALCERSCHHLLCLHGGPR